MALVQTQDPYLQQQQKAQLGGEFSAAGSGALAGAGTGAAIGSVVPGIGTAIGAGVGALAGGAIGFFKQRSQDKQQDIIAQQQAMKQSTMMQPMQSQMMAPQPMQAPQPYYDMSQMPQQNYAQTYAYGGYIRGNLHGYSLGGTIAPYWRGGYIKGYQDGDTVTTPDPYATGYGAPVNIDTSKSSFGAQSNFGTNFGNPNIGAAIPGIANTASQAAGLNPYIAGGTLALGLLQAGVAQKRLQELQKEPIPTIGVSSQLQQAYQRAQEASQRGYSPEQEAAFKQNLATQQNTAYQQAIAQSGGNLAGAIGAGLQSQNIGALNQFAAEDAARKQANIQYADKFAEQFQGIQDENTRAALQRRMAREQALGTAEAQGFGNLASVANQYFLSKAGQPKKS